MTPAKCKDVRMEPLEDLAKPTLTRQRSTRPQRLAYGKGLREKVSREDLGGWQASPDRVDPVRQVIESDYGRVGMLIPLRHGRMATSPYGFFRGAASIFADDCATLPYTGIKPIVCGDAHMGNFGFYRSPEGELVMDVNDFDEAHPGPWEWDLRRLVASLWIAGRENGVSEDDCHEAVMTCVIEYRDELRWLATQPLLRRSFNRLDVDRLKETVNETALHSEIERAVKKARKRTSDRSLPKITKEESDGKRKIIDDPPLFIHTSPARAEQLGKALDNYLETLQPQWQRLLDGYTLVDVAHKVVGVGSVGLRSYLALLQGSSPEDVLFLQLKQARRSVLAKHVHGDVPLHSHQGQRVVEYQQCLQPGSDPLLGGASPPALGEYDPDDEGLDEGSGPVQFYVRQWRNMKGAILIDDLDPKALADYAGVLGLLLAKSHARTSGASMIIGYIGKSDKLAEAMSHFARAYADQNESDHEKFVKAIKDGRIASIDGI